jgi:predicted methyltransferase
MLVLAYHDIYFVDAENDWPKIDGPQFLAQLKKSLKPGGMLAVVDHYAAAGSPRETGGLLHRIDPQIVIDELESEGFVLEGKSDVLRNLDDDHSLSMYDPEIRGKTDRFVLKFRLPK